MTKPNEKQRKSNTDVSRSKMRQGAKKINSEYTASHAEKASDRIEDQINEFINKGGKIYILPDTIYADLKSTAQSISKFD